MLQAVGSFFGAFAGVFASYALRAWLVRRTVEQVGRELGRAAAAGVAKPHPVHIQRAPHNAYCGAQLIEGRDNWVVNLSLVNPEVVCPTCLSRFA